ncbi:serine protease [Nocardia sp. NPDC046473]|uniref:serine protease n=1 Tax=Nocardia sp. NPDC046473 TaxID=3155733 RepID=UPI0033F7940A
MWAWGVTRSGGAPATALQFVSIPVVYRTTCNTRYEQDQITPNMVCAGEEAGGKYSCDGDGGGPLVDSRSTLVGITSWGHVCAQSVHPGVYTRVGNYISWINQHRS